jgi:hypothetical protein
MVPAHVRIEGNKEANQVAKLAASQQGYRGNPTNLNSTRLRGETLHTDENHSKIEEPLGEHRGGEDYQTAY